MVDINQVYKSNSDHLKAEDLETGKTYSLTVKEIEQVAFKDDKGAETQKLVLSFGEAEKSLVLNKTNATTIASVHGGETNDWIGKEIGIYRTMVDFGGRQVDALRVDMPREAASLGAPATGESLLTAAVEAVKPDLDDAPF
tara:strand:+ start:545 stop:967 length:423 start_codon:yes stop_codon:yes gene_type:complete